jgi:hypothetical protein
MLKYLTGLLAVVGIAGGGPADTDDRPRQLFDVMEQKVTTGKSLECAFEIKAELSEGAGPAVTRDLDAFVVAADGSSGCATPTGNVQQNLGATACRDFNAWIRLSRPLSAATAGQTPSLFTRLDFQYSREQRTSSRIAGSFMAAT